MESMFLSQLTRCEARFFRAIYYRSCFFSVRECNELVDVDMVSVKLKLKLILKPFVCEVFKLCDMAGQKIACFDD